MKSPSRSECPFVTIGRKFLGYTEGMKVRVVADKRIFCLYVALNAMVYGGGNAGVVYSVRQRVWEWFGQQNLTLEPLKQFFAKYPEGNYYRFRDWALSHGEPPEFSEINDFWRRNNPKELDGFAELLRDFWVQTNLEQLWRDLSEDYLAVVGETQINGEIVAKQVQKYLRMKDMGIDELVIVPNLLENYNTGFGPKLGRVAYAILGPSENGFSVSRISHELLHSIINPLTEDYDKAKRSSLREYIIRAMVLRMNPDQSRHQELIIETYPQLDQFWGKLRDFEADGQPFDEYLRTWLPTIRLD